MFNDWRQALEAESLPLNPNPLQEVAAASRVTARSACDKDDLAELLDALGAPTDEDTLTTLLPLLPETGDDTMTANAFAATAASMLNHGDSPDHVRDTLGLSESELAEALHYTGQQAPDGDTPTPAADADTPEAAGPEPAGAAGSDGIEALLSWAKTHPAAGIRHKAARIRGDLYELTVRRAADDAQREAEERVAKLKAELEKAQETLRVVKAGGRPAAPTVTPAPTGTKRSKEQLAAIRTWARAHGHQVADAGMLRKSVVDAYEAAHRTTTLAEAG
ncbi:histone-like nucleoid-structuring protein Lsr2 [Streptomyces mirabilis]|uniref:Lsr2 family DNA-binding protein n=1 Tax=Streptomyces mirabilis TaxID=68239 RepID=UPI003797FA99